MATLNFIMPRELQEGFCNREAKQNKVKHAWVPSGQTRAIFGDQIAIECRSSVIVNIVINENGPRLLALSLKCYRIIGRN